MSNTMKNIEWADKTWNPVTGCSRNCKWPAPDGRVVGCYARAICERFHHQPDFSVPVFHEDRLNDPDRWRKARRIFVCSMGDLFGPEVPDAWVHRVLKVIELCPRHSFLLLTKNSKRLREFTYPDNVWVGVTLTHDGETIWRYDAPHKWISYEPLTEEIHFGAFFLSNMVQWVVIGALSAGGKKYQPKREWVENILRAAEGLPVFIKDNLDCEALGIERRQELP